MKTLKRTLALVLAVVMVFAAFGMTAGAYTDDAAITNKEAVEVLSMLDIINGFDDGSFQPTANVTREQVAKLICYTLLGGKIADTLGCEEDPFDDVAATRWSAPYIAYCEKIGIINGYGDGNYGPTDNVTGYQLVKMLLCSLGYGKNGEYTGKGYEIAVAVDGNDLGLFKGVDADYSQPATREQAAQYIFNTLFAELVSYSKDTEDYTGKGTTLADKFGLKKEDAVGPDGRDGYIWTVGDEESSIYYVEGFDYEFIANKDYDGDYATAVKEQADKDLVVASDVELWMNGEKGGWYLYKGDEVGLICEKIDGVKTVTKIVMVEWYIDYVVSIEEAAEDAEYDYNVELDYFGDCTDKDLADIFDGLEEGDAVMIAENYHTDEIYASAIPVAVTGKVTAVNADKEYIKIDGVKYETYLYSYPTIGNEYTFYFINGYIYDYELVEEAASPVSEDFFHVIAWEAAVDSGSEGTLIDAAKEGSCVVKAKVMFPDGTIKVVDVATYFDEDDDCWKYEATDDEVTNQSYYTVGCWINYTVNDDGAYVFDVDNGYSYYFDDAQGNDFAYDADAVAVLTNNAEVKYYDSYEDAYYVFDAYANAKTELTVISVVYDGDGNIKSVKDVKTVTGIKNFPNDNKAYKWFDGDSLIFYKDGVISKIYAIDEYVEPSTIEEVNYAVYVGKGETDATGTLYTFIVDGAEVEYYVSDTLAATLTEDGYYDIKVNGKNELTAASELTATQYTVAAVEDSFFKTTDGDFIYFAADYDVWNITKAVKAGTLAKDAVVDVFFNADGQAEMIYIVG